MTRPIYLLELGSEEGDSLTVWSNNGTISLSVSGEDYPFTKIEEMEKVRDTLTNLLMSMRPK
jgi:hypothetical protein